MSRAIAAKAIRAKHLTSDHPELLTAMNNEGVMFQKQGKYKDAIAVHAQVLAGRERALGSEHPDVAMSLMNLGLSHLFAGNVHEGEENLNRALTIARRAFGEQHPKVADIINNLAAVYTRQDRLGDCAFAKETWKTQRPFSRNRWLSIRIVVTVEV